MMRSRRMSTGRMVWLVAALTVAATCVVPGLSSATTGPKFTECPAAGADTGCAILITISPNGNASVATDPSQPPMSPTGVLVGVVNESNAIVTGVSVKGTAGNGAFYLHGQGVCAVHPTPCSSPTEYGPTGYEGPGVSLAVASPTEGKVNFTSGLAPGASTYLSLASMPIVWTAVCFSSAIAVTATSLNLPGGVPFSGQVGTFTDGNSFAGVTDFDATINWGDGTVTPATVSQPGGPGTPYVVSAGHTYYQALTFTTTVTVTDNVMIAFSNTGSATATAVVSNPVTLAPVTLARQVVGVAFSGPVATITGGFANPTPSMFTASIDWGAQAGGVEQVSPGTITQPGGPGTPLTVSGTNTYAVSGDFTVTVTVTFESQKSSVTDPVEVVLTQTSFGCTGNKSSGGTAAGVQSATATANCASGTIYIAIGNGSLGCTGLYDHAPYVTTVTTNGLPSTVTIRVQVRFPREDLQGPYGVPIQACFVGSHPFPDINGNITPPTLVNGQIAYVGLLPKCMRSVPARYGPCLGHVSIPIPGWKTVVERIRFPAADPKFR